MRLMHSRPQQRPLNDLDGDEIQNQFQIARRLHELVSEHPDFDVLGPPAHDVYRLRYVPNGLIGREEEPEVTRLLDHLNQEIVEMVRRCGFASVMRTTVESCVAIQISISPAIAPTDDIDATFEVIARWGRLLNKKNCLRSERTTEMEAQLC